MTRRCSYPNHEPEEKHQTPKWRMMNDETKKGSAVEERPSKLIGYKQRLSPTAAA